MHPSTSHNLRSTIAPHLSRDRTRTTTRTRKHTHKNIKERRVGQPKIRQNHWPANQPSNQATGSSTDRAVQIHPVESDCAQTTTRRHYGGNTNQATTTTATHNKTHTTTRTQTRVVLPLSPLFLFPWLGSRTTTDNKHQASTVQDTTNPSLSYSHT